jgi:hypothetical protein
MTKPGSFTYSSWFDRIIKDNDLAEAARMIERETVNDAAQGRTRFKEAVERRYTAPA